MAELELTEALGAWVARHGENRAGGISVELVSSSQVDLDGATATARATVWNSGVCDAEVLDRASGEQLFWKHHESVSADMFYDILRDLVSQLQHHAYIAGGGAPLLPRILAEEPGVCGMIREALTDGRKRRIDLNLNVFDVEIDVVRSVVTLADDLDPHRVQRIPLSELVEALDLHAANLRRERFGRVAFQKVTGSLRFQLADALALSLADEILGAADFHEAIDAAIRDLREMGHDLWSYDAEEDWEVWGPGHQTRPGILITFKRDYVLVEWTDF